MTELNKYDLFDQGIFIDRMTSREALSGLVRALHPVKTKFELVRFGGQFDGGYLLPDDLDGISICFSPGVDVTASFEIDILDRRGIRSHLADFSVDGPPMNFTPKSFIKKFIAPFDDDQHMTMDTWMRTVSDAREKDDLLLQMDIEGGEYLSLLNLPEEMLKRFRIIVVEIHNVEAWGQQNFFDVVQNFFVKVLRNYWVVHNHPNNCCGIVNLGGVKAPRVFELSLLRKDRSEFQGFSDQFPHKLDRPNLSDRPDLILPEEWSRS